MLAYPCVIFANALPLRFAAFFGLFEFRLSAQECGSAPESFNLNRLINDRETASAFSIQRKRLSVFQSVAARGLSIYRFPPETSVGGSALLFPFLVGGPRVRRCFMTMQREMLSSSVNVRNTMPVPEREVEKLFLPDVTYFTPILRFIALAAPRAAVTAAGAPLILDSLD